MRVEYGLNSKCPLPVRAALPTLNRLLSEWSEVVVDPEVRENRPRVTV